jgi:hypothetical protein
MWKSSKARQLGTQPHHSPLPRQVDLVQPYRLTSPHQANKRRLPSLPARTYNVKRILYIYTHYITSPSVPPRNLINHNHSSTTTHTTTFEYPTRSHHHSPHTTNLTRAHPPPTPPSNSHSQTQSIYTPLLNHSNKHASRSPRPTKQGR